MRFVPFVEKNDWEGETWTFWLQLDGNEFELAKLHELLFEERFEYEPAYSIDMNDAEDEEVVDRICARARGGYNDSDSKITGKFTCPELSPTMECLDDNFYKGRIEDHFRE